MLRLTCAERRQGTAAWQSSRTSGTRDGRTATTNAALQRAEEAQTRAQKAEVERDALRDYDSPFVAEGEDLRAEVARFRRALDAMARGVVHMADAVSEIANGEEGAP